MLRRVIVLTLMLTPYFTGLAPQSAVAGDQDNVRDHRHFFSRGGFRDVTLSAVSEFRVELTEGDVVTFETTGLSYRSDPVLHLLSSRRGPEVAVDDNSGEGKNARIVYDVPESGQYMLIVRSRTNQTDGKGNLLMNSEVWQSDVEFGGWHADLSNLRANEEIVTVRQPNGAASPQVLYMLKEDGLGIETNRQRSSGGVAGGTAYRLDSDVGNRSFIAGVSNSEAAGDARLIRNDAGLSGHDPDGDRLGSELEDALGTCSNLTDRVAGSDRVEFDCSLAAAPRDTDGDGISDGLEVLGDTITYERDSGVRVHESLPLPLWGADPRHKDLFIEVDFQMREPNEASERLTPAVAREFAAYYEDTWDEPDQIADAHRAETLRNPDGKRGINVHLDTGVDPEKPEDATTYGDWGGYNAVEPVRDEEGDWKGADPQEAWNDNLSPARLGVFRYLMIYPTGGGQAPTNAFAASGPADNAWVLAHEFGHAMGLGHSGVADSSVPDANCKPNYPSMMNYAFQSSPQIGFSDGRNVLPLNNTALTEWQAVSPDDTAYLDVLEDTYEYYVDREHGHVDWNRDGEIAPEGETVRAYANYRPGGSGCEYTRRNQSYIDGTLSTYSPAMARLDDRLYMFYSLPLFGTLNYVFSSDLDDCPEPDTTPCASWGHPRIAYMDAQGGVDVIRIGEGDDAELLVVTIDRDGTIWERRFWHDSSGNDRRSDARKIATDASATGEPSLAIRGDCYVHLAYRGKDGNVRHNRLTCVDDYQDWRGGELALDQDGDPIEMTEDASPGIGHAYLGTFGWIHGAFAGPDGRLDLYVFNELNGRWEQSDLLDGRPGPIEGRPALAWTSENTITEYQGKFYLAYISTSSNPARHRMVRMVQSYVEVEEQADGSLDQTLKVGLDGPFDNVWLLAHGIDLFFEAGVDSNLRAALPRSSGNDSVDRKLQFRPKADGINDFDMNDHNDWEVLRTGLCKNVVNPGGLVSNPITCPAA